MCVEEVALNFYKSMQDIVETCFLKAMAHLTDSIISSSVWRPYRKYVGNTVVTDDTGCQC